MTTQRQSTKASLKHKQKVSVCWPSKGNNQLQEPFAKYEPRPFELELNFRELHVAKTLGWQDPQRVLPVFVMAYKVHETLFDFPPH